jgi:hypothetical protein
MILKNNLKPKQISKLLIVWMISISILNKNYLINNIKKFKFDYKLFFFGFILQVINSTAVTIYNPWKINKLFNDDPTDFDDSKNITIISYNIYELYLWFDYIISMIMFVKMEKSFILAQFLADIITKNLILLSYCSKKNFKK